MLTEAMIEYFGWFLISACFLGLWSRWLSAGTVGLPDLWLVACLGFGMAAAIRFSNWYKPSGSARELAAMEAKPRTRRQKDRSAAIHWTARRNEPVFYLMPLLVLVTGIVAGGAYWMAVIRLESLDGQLFLELLPFLGALIYAVITAQRRLAVAAAAALYALLLFSWPAASALVWMIAVTCALWYYAWREQDMPLLAVTLLGGYLVLARLAGEASFSADLGLWVTGAQAVLPALAIWLAFLVLSALSGLSFVRHTRQADQKRLSQLALGGSVVLFSFLPFAMGDISLASWLASGLVLLLVWSAFGYLAWAYHGKYSYAKYYFLAALAVLMLLALVLIAQPQVTMLWTLLACLLLGLGFGADSYSARMVGLAVLVLAMLHFALFSLAPTDGAPLLPVEQSALSGLSLVVVLVMLRYWYARVGHSLIEKDQMPAIQQGLFLAALALVGGIIYRSVPPLLADVGWLMLGGLAYVWGRSAKYAFTQAFGISLAVISLVKLGAADLQVISPAYQFTLCSGVVLLALAALLLRPTARHTRLS